MTAFVYEGEKGELLVEEGGFSSRGLYDDVGRDLVDVIELAADHFHQDGLVRLVSGDLSAPDVELGRFRVTIERLDK